MRTSMLSSTDFASYREILAALLPEGFSIALTNLQGHALWRDAAFPEGLLRPAVISRLRDSDGSAPAQPREAETGDPDLRAGVAFVSVENAGPIALLWAAGPASFPAHFRWLQTIADHMSKDLAVGAELNAMAEELGERYEELNLVYNTPDEVRFLSQGTEALERLVANCQDYLSVELATLVVPRKGISIRQCAPEVDVRAIDELANRIAGPVLRHILSSGEALVINTIDDPSHPYWQGLAYHLVAIPLVNRNKEAEGVLALATGFGGRRFANSDRNLLQVMARKAGKILQGAFDDLTGLLRREGLEHAIDALISDTRATGRQGCLLHIDIDQLHVINDSVSHEAGDAIIRAAAETLQSGARGSDTLARIGGDEFGLMLVDCPMASGLRKAEAIREQISEMTMIWQERPLMITASIGVVPIDSESGDPSAALSAAELACDMAKDAGKSQVHGVLHDDSDFVARHSERETVGHIRHALAHDDFLLYGQPIESTRRHDSRLHFEVLLRMRDGAGRILPPSAFLSAAERYSLMPDIDEWVIRATLRQIGDHWEDLADRIGLVSINLSGQSLNQPGFTSALAHCLETSRVPRERICFEITETAAVSNLEAAKELIGCMKATGVRFALDDFGAGLSSFQYLSALPVDFLKIDGSLIRQISGSNVYTTMVAAIKQIADVMELETIAEFVEDNEILGVLRSLGIDHVQGYAIGRPIPLDELLGARSAGGEAAAR